MNFYKQFNPFAENDNSEASRKIMKTKLKSSLNYICGVSSSKTEVYSAVTHSSGASKT